MSSSDPDRSAFAQRILLPTLMLAIFLGGLDTTLFNASVHRMSDVLASQAKVWFVDVYALTLASTVVFCSRLGVLIGPGRTLSLGAAIFSLGSLFPALVDSAELWIASRAIQGFGYALMVSSVVSIIGLF